MASPSTVASEEEDGYHCLTSDVESGAAWHLGGSTWTEAAEASGELGATGSPAAEGALQAQLAVESEVERLQNCGVLGLRCVLEAGL